MQKSIRSIYSGDTGCPKLYGRPHARVRQLPTQPPRAGCMQAHDAWVHVHADGWISSKMHLHKSPRSTPTDLHVYIAKHQADLLRVIIADNVYTNITASSSPPPIVVDVNAKQVLLR